MEVDVRNRVLLGLCAVTCGVLEQLRARQQRRNRRYKVRPINRNRDTEGEFATLVKQMKNIEYDFEQYFKYTRMTPTVFSQLVELVGPNLQKMKQKNPLSPEHQLMMCIHYLAQGGLMQDLAWRYRVGKATVHVVVRDTCAVLWNILLPIVLPTPTVEDLKNICNGFYTLWNMPNCFGSVDGKHISIQAPPRSGTTFYNYKKYYSIVLMATCNANYEFVYVDIGGYGSNHDSAIFNNSAFGKALMDGRLNIPEPRTLPHTDVMLPCFLIGDEAFPLHNNIMRPFGGRGLGEREKIFNYRLSRARRTIENAFGILCQRWRILRKTIVANVELCELIVQACVVLHNFIQVRVEPNGEDVGGEGRKDGFRLPGGGNHRARRGTAAALQNRNTLADYFISDSGSVPWQLDYILRGSLPE